MRHFDDLKGRRWTIHVDAWTAEEIYGLTGFDIFSILFRQDASAFLELSTPRILGPVVWATIKDQAATRDVDLADFRQAFRKDAPRAALFALLDAVADFLPEAEEKKMRRVIQQARSTATPSETPSIDLPESSASIPTAATPSAPSTSPSPPADATNGTTPPPSSPP